MKSRGFQVCYSEQDNAEYIFNYNPNPVSSSTIHRLTVPLAANDLYIFRSAPGVWNLLQCAPLYPNIPPAFATPAVLPSPLSDPYCRPVGKTREISK